MQKDSIKARTSRLTHTRLLYPGIPLTSMAAISGPLQTPLSKSSRDSIANLMLLLVFFNVILLIILAAVLSSPGGDGGGWRIWSRGHHPADDEDTWNDEERRLLQ